MFIRVEFASRLFRGFQFYMDTVDMPSDQLVRIAVSHLRCVLQNQHMDELIEIVDRRKFTVQVPSQTSREQNVFRVCDV